MPREGKPIGDWLVLRSRFIALYTDGYLQKIAELASG